MGNRNNDRNGSSYGNNTNPRPSRFSNKRSRSRSPVRQSRFDNDSNDFKRPRTDHSRPSHVSFDSIYFFLNVSLHSRTHQRMVMVFILNDPIKNLNQMECHHHHLHQQVILTVDSTTKPLHIHHHRCIHPRIQCMVNHLNSLHFHQVHHLHPRKILCFFFYEFIHFIMKYQRNILRFSLSLNTLLVYFLCLLFLFFLLLLFHTYITHHHFFVVFSCSFRLDVQ